MVDWEKMKVVLSLFSFQIGMIILYINFVSYDKEANGADPRNSLDPARSGYDQDKNPISHYDPCKPFDFNS